MAEYKLSDIAIGDKITLKELVVQDIDTEHGVIVADGKEILIGMIEKVTPRPLAKGDIVSYRDRADKFEILFIYGKTAFVRNIKHPEFAPFAAPLDGYTRVHVAPKTDLKRERKLRYVMGDLIKLKGISQDWRVTATDREEAELVSTSGKTWIRQSDYSHKILEQSSHPFLFEPGDEVSIQGFHAFVVRVEEKVALCCLGCQITGSNGGVSYRHSDISAIA